MKTLYDAIEYRRLGDLSGALNVLSGLLKSDPNNPLIYFHMAWTHDSLGKERDAVELYNKALKLGISGEDRKEAYLGLGSTLRCMGEYEESKLAFENGIAEFPNYRPLKVFLALTENNLKNQNQAVQILLTQLIETTTDSDIKKYERALKFYQDKLEVIFD